MYDNVNRIAARDPVELAREPAAVDLIERFPLPIAMFDSSGDAVLLNRRFNQRYREEILHSPPMREALREAGAGWKTLKIPRGANDEVACRAQTIDLPGGSMLILDEAPDDGVLRELDQLHAQLSALQRLCSIDALTGAWNRSHFEQIVAGELERSVHHRQPVSLVIFDIDHFKRVNDAHGHRAGDSVLRELVSVVRKTIRSIDTLFRWGGDEFVVIADSMGYRRGAALAEKIKEAVETHRFQIVGSVTVSLGVAERLAPESAETWLRRLDSALYRAKDSGRNRVWVERLGSSDSWAAESGPSIVRLAWQEAYECGEPKIDAQHRELFTLANAAFDASFKTPSTDTQFKAAIDRLLAHIVKHFADEEQALDARHYVGLAWHKLAHADLLAQAGELRTAVAAGRITTGDLVDYLADKVVAAHMFRVDKMFFPLFSDPTTGFAG
jgi:diguanylate cyclase (GGDEF)-like protein/hemerythrin-like metal-binding protein